MIIIKEQQTEYEKENNYHICEKSLMDLPQKLANKQRIHDEITDYLQSKMIDVAMKYWYIKIKLEDEMQTQIKGTEGEIKQLEDKMQAYKVEIEKYTKERNEFLDKLDDNMAADRDIVK